MIGNIANVDVTGSKLASVTNIFWAYVHLSSDKISVYTAHGLYGTKIGTFDSFAQADAAVVDKIKSSGTLEQLENELRKVKAILRKTMRELETDAIPRPTKEILDNAIDGITSKMGLLSIAAYQETKNNRAETGGRIAIQLETIRQAVNNLKELRGQL